MPRPRLSLARVMLVVAILAIDCALLQAAGSWGMMRLLTIGPAATLGLIGAVVTSGRPRRFFVGFTAGAAASAVVVLAIGPLFDAGWEDLLTRVVPSWAPDVTTTKVVVAPGVTQASIEYGPVAIALLLACMNLPVLTASLIGGALALRRGRPAPSDPVPAEPNP